ncbi:hypothetical protein QBC46DRAFT_409320 [Diplogelasinospora grovesii]|uniref:Uncharacterized protein n=1 Tax=Diplogelasinospora grovesii TaxID=303347 RepID=A0AAN6N525_9PEZI|nr:hypothetical protein QBC46DRAFT_409320 [Diplogelasinospora grovesii]
MGLTAGTTRRPQAPFCGARITKASFSLNTTLSTPLDKSWTNSTVQLKPIDKPDMVGEGFEQLWVDTTDKAVFAWGGSQADGDVPSTISLHKMTPDGSGGVTSSPNITNGPTPTPSSGPSAGAIAGGVVGGVIFIAILAAIFFSTRKRKKAWHQQQHNAEVDGEIDGQDLIEGEGSKFEPLPKPPQEQQLEPPIVFELDTRLDHGELSSSPIQLHDMEQTSPQERPQELHGSNRWTGARSDYEPGEQART